jgi:type I restriction-modification system DNA methylase subunit
MLVILLRIALLGKGPERKIRQFLIEHGFTRGSHWVRANIFYCTTLAACILVFLAHKPKKSKGKVLR